MNRQDKQVVVDGLKKEFAANKATFLVGMQGMTVEQLFTLRRELYKHASELKVAKNTLLIKAANELPEVQKLTPYFKNQIGVIFANDFAPIAKVLVDKAKDIPALRLITGCVESDLMDIKVLASLGSREVQVARLCGVLKANVARLAMVLKMAHDQQQSQG